MVDVVWFGYGAVEVRGEPFYIHFESDVSNRYEAIVVPIGIVAA